MTIVYKLEGSAGTDSDCTPAAGNNEKALATRIDASVLVRDIPLETADEISHAWTTEASNPNVADWPSGNYFMRANISFLESTNVSLKFQLLRVNSGCTSQVNGLPLTSSSFTTTGDKTFDTGTIDPSSGAAGDRFQAIILGSNTKNMARSFNIDPNAGFTGAGAEIEGPWTTGVDEIGAQASQMPGTEILTTAAGSVN